jgi:multicomponent K+:H+ antiporter subunit D
VYALLRTSALFAAGGAPSAPGGDVLFAFGTATAVLAAFGMLGTHRLPHQAGLSVVVSAGTLLAALGLGREATGGALYYLASSVLSASALFLLIDLVERWQNTGTTIQEPAPFLTPALERSEVSLDDEEEPLVGVPFPGSVAFLGIAFLACSLLVAGLPPLSSFVGKVLMLTAALGAREGGAAVPARVWVFLGVLLGTGFVTLVAMMRTGIRTFWAGSRDAPRPQIRLAEGLPIVLLLGASLALAVGAGPVSRYAGEAARALAADHATSRTGAGSATP